MKNRAKIEVCEDSLLIDKKILVFGDVHLGLEESISSRHGFPRLHLKELSEKVNRIFTALKKRKIKITKIIILGDLKHDFGSVTISEWGDVRKFLQKLITFIDGDQEDKLIIVKGNHDNYLNTITRKENIKLVQNYVYKDVCFLHGHEMYQECLNKDIKCLILSHLHPAIIFDDGYKSEKFKCFLKGKWNKKMVYVMPGFSLMSIGFSLNEVIDKDYKNKNDDFFIINNKDLQKLEVIVYNNKDGEEYNFGKLKNL
ncbi:metallophosphoesterase [Candidatus Pacearchaeota archaeon]|nr:metallophosphoesterase [Candidatus Pacearchaeota archaeon]